MFATNDQSFNKAVDLILSFTRMESLNFPGLLPHARSQYLIIYQSRLHFHLSLSLSLLLSLFFLFSPHPLLFAFFMLFMLSTFTFILLVNNFFHHFSGDFGNFLFFGYVLTLSCLKHFLLHFISTWFFTYFTFQEHLKVSGSYLYIPSAQKSSQIINVKSCPSSSKMLPGIISQTNPIWICSTEKIQQSHLHIAGRKCLGKCFCFLQIF